jgi:integrase
MPLKLVPPREGRSPHFRVRGTYLGVYLDRSTGARDERVARRVLAKWRQEIESGQLVASSAPTFAEAAIAYMKWGGEKRFLPRLLHHMGDVPIDRIGQAEVDAAATALYPSAAPSTLNRLVYTPISAVVNHLTPDRPLRLRRPKQPPGRTAWATPEQVEALLAAMKSKLRRLAIFLVYSGCRISEAVNLDWECVNLDTRMAYIVMSKNGDARAVHLTPAMLAAMGEISPKVGRVFGYKHRWSVAKRWRKAATDAGLPWLTPHVMRHTWATWMRRYGGAKIDDLIATGAWRSVKSAMRYTHVVQAEEARKADLLPSLTRAKTVESGNK